jgi:2-phosphosulfolactate phosphatase
MPSQLDVVLLPPELQPGRLCNRAVAVFDVLRATTSMAAALAAGIAEIRIFPDVESARAAGESFTTGPKILCGEARCLAPPGFDLGNSPGAFNEVSHAGRTAFMSTTNGTRAILAAREAAACFVAALVNASAAAAALAATGRDITLICAGTNGRVAMEDVLGCGAVIAALESQSFSGNKSQLELVNDSARIARRLFLDNQHRLREVMADSDGGRNVIGAGLSQDIDFAARVDAIPVVGIVSKQDPIALTRWKPG